MQGQNDPDYEVIVKAIRAIVFLSTTHRGTNLAKTPNRILQVSFVTAPKHFISNSYTLQKLNEQFRHIAPKLDIVSFYGTHPTPIGMFQLVSHLYKVVFQRWSFIRERERRAEGSTTKAAEGAVASTIRFPNQFICVKILLIPEAALILWVIASSYSVWYVIQTIIPVIFQQTYKYNELQIGLAYLHDRGGLVFGGLAAGRLMDRNYAHFAEKSGLDPR